MTIIRTVLLLMPLTVISAAPAAAGCDAGQGRNNPAFSDGVRPAGCAPAKPAAARPGTPAKPVATRPAPPLRPEERTMTGLDVPTAGSPAGTTTTDADGRTVTKIGDTEIRIGGSIQTEFYVGRR